jgi:nucleoside-diphosphate-sugar epimerase
MAWHLLAVNVGAAVQAAQQARAIGATRFIYASSGSVYAPSFEALTEACPVRRDDWYALSKVQAEEALALFARADATTGAAGLDVTVVRPFCIFGPGQTNMLVPNLLDSMLAGRPIYVEPSAADGSDRDGLRITPCYIDDAVEILCDMIHRGQGATAAPFAAVPAPGRTATHNAAPVPAPYVRAAHPSPEIVNLAGPEIISIRQLATELGRLVGKTPNIEISPRLRQGNLIADVTFLRRTYEPSFTSLQMALELTVRSEEP